MHCFLGKCDDKPAATFLNVLSAVMVVFKEVPGLWQAGLEINKPRRTRRSRKKPMQSLRVLRGKNSLVSDPAE
jgi:hypothetical protein